MAKVVVRKETQKLMIDFTYRGVRCREQTALVDTAANRQRLQTIVRKLEQARRKGEFRYRDFFPQSPMAARFDEAAPSTADVGNTPTPVSKGPLFSAYATQWFEERKIEWRRELVRNFVCEA